MPFGFIFKSYAMTFIQKVSML